MSGFDIGVSYNTATSIDEVEMDMMTLSAGYAVNDNLSLSASRTSYGEGGFASTYGNMMAWGGNDTTFNAAGDTVTGVADGSAALNWLATGNMGHLAPEDVAMSIGVDYDMGAISLNASWTNITSGAEDAGYTRNDVSWEDWDRTIMDFGLGYNLNDNASLSLRYVTDAVADEDEDKYMWLGLQITP